MESGKPKQLQVFLESPQLRIRNRVLTLNLNDPSQTWGHLKQSLFGNPNNASLFLSLNGKPLDESCKVLSCQGLRPLSTLILHLKVLGGGGDGGSTCAESRDCYLNMYAEKKPDKVDPNEKRLSKWTTCALSFEPLKPPCVIDRLGNVFNKETLVKALLGKTLPNAFRHIKGLKDMVTIHLSDIPGFKEEDTASASASTSRFQCPITGLEFNGKYRFFALIKCGHVLSAKALKEVKSSSCLVCHQDFEEADKILINGTDDEVAALRVRMGQQRKSLKEKKPRRGAHEDDPTLEIPHQLSGKKHGIAHVDGVEKPSAELQLAAKAAADSSPAAKAAANAPTDARAANVKRFKAVDVAPPNANKQVYASIFTSSRKSDFKETYSCRSLPLGRN